MFTVDFPRPRFAAFAMIVVASSACQSTEAPAAAVPIASEAACDHDALRDGVAKVNAALHEHPAWFGDLSPDRRLATLPQQTIASACPRLSTSLLYAMESRDDSADVPAGSLARSVSLLGSQPDIAALRRHVCADESVFAEARSLPASERGPLVLRRCRFEAVGLGDATQVVRVEIGLLGFMVYQALVDDGVTESLARDAVLTLAFPRPDDSVRADLPTIAHALPSPRQAILVRVRDGTIARPGAPAPTETSDPKPLRSWLQAELEATSHARGENADVLIEATGTTPADVVANVVAALDGTGTESVSVLVREPGGSIGAEVYWPLAAGDPVPTTLAVRDGQWQLRAGSEQPAIVSGALSEGFGAFERWSAGVAQDPPIVVVDTAGLTVQQLVDITGALRGTACDLMRPMAGEDLPVECHRVGGLALLVPSATKD